MTESAVDLFTQLAQNDFGFFQRVNTLSGIMTKSVKSVTLDDTHEQVSDFLRRNQIHHAPVVEQGVVVGIVSDRDLLRYRPPRLGTAAEGDDDHMALRAPASQFVSREPVTVPASATPLTAVSLMLEYHIDCVLVHNQALELAGIVTTRDFLRLVQLFHQVCTRNPRLERLRLVDLDVSRGLPIDVLFSRGARSVRDVMSKEVHCLVETDTIERAMEVMRSEQIRHLPVVNDAQRLVGWVTDRHILAHLPLPVPRLDPRKSYGFREGLFAIQDAKSVRQPVTTIMESKPATVAPDSLLVDAINILLSRATSGVLVVETGERRPCGILTTTDILRVFRIALAIGSLLNGVK